MIIGKSLTALGGGGLKPEIRVTAKAGALLNLHYKDSSIILQSYQLVEAETQHTFVVGVSDTAYVIEDTSNGKSVEVLVDAVAVFDVGITYALYLYKDGDECTEMTGGWIRGDTNSANYITKYDDRMLIYYYYTGADAVAKTANTIPTAGYSSLHIKFDLQSYVDDSNYALVGFEDGDSWSLVNNTTDTSLREITIDISGVNLAAPLYVKCYDVRVNLYQLWLE